MRDWFKREEVVMVTGGLVEGLPTPVSPSLQGIDLLLIDSRMGIRERRGHSNEDICGLKYFSFYSYVSYVVIDLKLLL